MKIIVLGAGLVGSVIARDLAEKPENRVTIADINLERLHQLQVKYDLETTNTDLSNPILLADLVEGYDLVIGALPGFLGFQTLKTVIESKKNVIDISFFEEDPFQLDELAKQNGVTAIVDCGVAPGLSNIILGHTYSILDKTNEFLCYVGGLPKIREWPFEYKAPFSPIDVLEEYTRFARYVEDGKTIIKPALSEPELLDFPEVGTLEAFNTDGLRTLLKTMDIPNMKEKTLRYPGHIEKMKMLRESGFFDKKPVKIGESTIKPIDLTSKLLFEKWKMKEEDEDITVMKIVVKGEKEDREITYEYYLFDEYDKEKKVISMARTTGYTCTAAARLIKEGIFSQKGIIAPEILGMEEKAYDTIIQHLKERNVIIKEKRY
ncbi:MAG: saccharopine dehydrogenase family protein [Candidatus Heimdallarchaeaceae archaeon]